MLLWLFILQAAACAQSQLSTYYGAYDPAAEPVYNREPNGFLVECVRGRKPGSALDVGMGSGRNSIFLAKQGWQVTGFDNNEADIEQAHAQALKAGVKVAAIYEDESALDFGINQWDLVILTYQPFHHLMGRIRTSLRDGGIVVLENFHEDTRFYRLIRNGLLANNELLTAFSDFRILRYEDILARPDWGMEFPRNRIVRLLAQKGNPRVPGCDWKGIAHKEGSEVVWGRTKLRCSINGWEEAAP